MGSSKLGGGFPTECTSNFCSPVNQPGLPCMERERERVGGRAREVDDTSGSREERGSREGVTSHLGKQ